MYSGPYNSVYSMENSAGWGSGCNNLSSRSGLASPLQGSPHFPTMSVNVSMNMTMHGVGYDPLGEQWQNYDQNYSYGHGCYSLQLRDDEDCIKDEEMHPRSFALFDSPSKLRFSSKNSPRFLTDDKQVGFIFGLLKNFTILFCSSFCPA